MAEDAILTPQDTMEAPQGNIAPVEASAEDTFNVTKVTEHSREIQLSEEGKTLTLSRLKAGKYYEAQQIFTTWMGNIQKLTTLKSGGGNIIKKDGEIDKSKVEALVTNSVDKDVEAILDVVKRVKDNQLQLVAIFVGKSKKEVEDSFYHEDIEAILWNGIRLNNFIGNIKK